jgi:hypothetical protein
MPSAEGLIVNATNRPIAAISQPAIRPARECDLSREFFDVSRSSGVAISVYPKLLVFAGYQESGGANAQEWESPSASPAQASQFMSIDNLEGTALASQLTSAPTPSGIAAAEGNHG